MKKQPGIDAVMMDFAHVMIEMMRFNTPFLNFFWYNSPTPNFQQGLNVMFWLIFALVFIALALQDSGARMSRQAKFLREGVNDQMILEKAKGRRRNDARGAGSKNKGAAQHHLPANFSALYSADCGDRNRLLLL